MCLFGDSEGVSKFQVSMFPPSSPSQIQRADAQQKIKNLQEAGNRRKMNYK